MYVTTLEVLIKSHSCIAVHNLSHFFNHKGPSGIPTVDSNNGYGRFVSPSNRGLAATPINEDVLTTDFDFDANLALFNKDVRPFFHIKNTKK